MALSTAERQRRRYRRSKAGRGCYVVEVDQTTLVELLLADGLIRPDQAHDRVAVGEALSRVVDGLLITLTRERWPDD